MCVSVSEVAASSSVSPQAAFSACVSVSISFGFQALLFFCSPLLFLEKKKNRPVLRPQVEIISFYQSSHQQRGVEIAERA